MLLVTVRDDLAEINRLLDEVETTRDPGVRTQRLAQSLVASRRALGQLMRDDGLASTLSQARDAVGPYDGAVREVVADAMLFEAFIQAEKRLFADLGLGVSAVDRLGTAMRDAGPRLNGDNWPTELLRERLQTVEAGVVEAIAALDARGGEAQERGHRMLKRVFLIVGGSFVCGANALVGAGATPVTGGLSIVGAAVSTNLGAGLIGAGIAS
jgi:hypothetical protein